MAPLITVAPNVMMKSIEKMAPNILSKLYTSFIPSVTLSGSSEGSVGTLGRSISKVPIPEKKSAKLKPKDFPKRMS